MTFEEFAPIAGDGMASEYLETHVSKSPLARRLPLVKLPVRRGAISSRWRALESQFERERARSCFQQYAILTVLIASRAERVKAGLSKSGLILLETCLKHRVSVEGVLSPSRAAHCIGARREIAYRWSEECRIGFSEIARRLNRDHSTIISAVRRYAVLNKLKLSAYEHQFVRHLKTLRDGGALVSTDHRVPMIEIRTLMKHLEPGERVVCQYVLARDE